MSVFGEAAVLNDGRRVIAPWNHRGLYIGDRFVDGPVLRLPDACMDGRGRIWAVGHEQTGSASHVYRDDGKWFPLAQGGFAARLIIRPDGDGIRLAMTTGPSTWRCVHIDTDWRVSDGEMGTIPSGEGAHGMRDWLDGHPRPLAPIDQPLLGYPVRSAVTVGTVTIACGLGALGDQMVIARDGHLGTLNRLSPDWPTPRLSTNGQHWTAVCYPKALIMGGPVASVLPPLIIAPAIAPFQTAAHVGAYFAVSTRYPIDPTAPGSCVVIAEPGLHTDRPVLLTRLAPIPGNGGAAELIPEWAARWAQVRAIHITSEDRGLILEAHAARQAMTAQGLAARPVVSYTGRTVPSALEMEAVDVVGVECYPNAGETVAQSETAWRAFISQTGTHPLALMLGQFDRNGTIPEAILAACQPRFEALCRELGSRIRFALAFSWGRPGGLRDHPPLQPWLASLAAAYPVPPAPTEPPVSDAKATITSFETPIATNQQSRAVAKTTQGTPTHYRWQYNAGAGNWITVATNPVSDTDHHYNSEPHTFPGAGRYPIRLQTMVDGEVTDTSNATSRIIEVVAIVPPPGPGPKPPPVPGPGEILIHLTDMKSERPIADAEAWWQPAPSVITHTDAMGYALVKATGSGVCVKKDGYHSPGLPNQPQTCKLTEPLIEFVLQRIPPPAPPVPVIHPAGRIFQDAANAPWRYKGVSAFKLCKRFADGENIQPFFDAYRGFNILRVWAYTDWAGTGWDASPANVTRDFFRVCAEQGFLVEFTLLTNDSRAKSDWARDYVAQLAEAPRPPVLIEGRNEPQTHSQTVSTKLLKPALDASRFVYASGNYEQSDQAFGPYLVAHTGRDSEWPRRAHDLMEYYNGGGPHKPSDPAHKVPCVGDEPAKPSDVAAPTPPLTKADDWRAYFGTCALLGAGGTFHCESGKWGQPPNAEETTLAAAALEGLDAFPADAPLGPYSRPSDNSLRTYIVGNYMVRIRPTSPNAPGAGWSRIGSSNILWKR